MWDDRPFYYNRIAGEVFHVTSIKGFAAIFNDGAIIANPGSRTYSFFKSNESFAKKMEYVALFDFRNCSEEKIRMMAHIWTPIVATHQPAIVLLLNYNKISQSLIKNKIAGCNYSYESMKDNYRIPIVEAWYPKYIPLSFCKAALEIDFTNSVITDIPIDWN